MYNIYSFINFIVFEVLFLLIFNKYNPDANCDTFSTLFFVCNEGILIIDCFFPYRSYIVI